MQPEASGYDPEDPAKIQGRDEVFAGERTLAGLRLDRALAALPDQPGDLLLPGAGAGRYARAIARERPAWNITAGDLSARAVAEAEALGGGPEYWVFDAEAPPFADEAFDAIIFLDLIEHLPHPRLFLDECRRMLRPGGVLHFFAPLEDEPGTLYRVLRNDRPIPIHRWKRDHVGHIQRYTSAALLQMVWDAGFEVSAVEYSFHVVGQTHDVLDYWARDRGAGGPGLLPAAAVQAVTRAAFVATWRLAFLEDRLYAGAGFASGIHVTATSVGDLTDPLS
jgi:SAM-dependent methyltransferase